MVAQALELLPSREPASLFLFPLPEMAHSCPPSHTRWGYSLLASRRRCSLTLRWPIPARGHALAETAPSCLSQRCPHPARGLALAAATACSQAGIPVPPPRDG